MNKLQLKYNPKTLWSSWILRGEVYIKPTSFLIWHNKGWRRIYANKKNGRIDYSFMNGKGKRIPIEV